MRFLVLALLLLLPIGVVPQSGVWLETYSSPQSFNVRLVNGNDYWVECELSDDRNYTTFTLGPYEHSRWFPIWGNVSWYCE